MQTEGKRAFLHTVSDITDRKIAERALFESLSRTDEARWAAVDSVWRAVAAKDDYTAAHTIRVANFAVAVGSRLGLQIPSIEAISVAGRLHDVGKIAVPTEILNKKGELTAADWERIRIHPAVSADILEPLPFDSPIGLIAGQHHERIDGSGYPKGLAREELTIESRVLAVADVAEAMALPRPYRPALGVDAAVAELRRHRGTLFEPDVVDASISLLEGGYRLVTGPVSVESLAGVSELAALGKLTHN